MNKPCGLTECPNTSTVSKYGVDLCSRHAVTFHNRMKTEYFSSRVRKLVETGELTQHSVGITYVMQLSNGNIKIGFTRDRDLLLKRLQKLTYETKGKPTLLATLPGGQTQEACLHSRFAEYRKYDLQTEQFFPAADIFWFARDTGLTPDGIWAKEQFEIWEPTPGFVVQPRQEDLPFLAVPCPVCGAEVSEPCTWRMDTSDPIHKSRKDALAYVGLG